MEKGLEINELELPLEITSEYICGCTKQERQNKFMEILKDFTLRKNEVQQKQDKMINGLKTGNKRDFEKHVTIYKYKY